MAEVLLFHHIQGLTEGVQAFADDLRARGHTVHVPDLYGGQTFASIEEGYEFQKEVDGDALADAAAADLPAALVYAGFSWGVMQAQRLAQTRPGAKGALLYESCVPISCEWAFGPWPEGVPVQIHGMDQDEFFAKEGDIDAAREIVESLGPDLAEVYTYPGDAHLFADRTLASYDAEATELLTQRSLAFLDRVS
jgi:dienelactone hydrolase